MNFSCVFLLALALFGAVSQAQYIGSGAIGYGGVGAMGSVGAVGCGGVGTMGSVGGVGAVGYNGLYESTCGGSYGAGYGAGYETAGYGCRTACSSAAVCDNCQCMKTIVRPNMIERVPYACARRIQAPTCRTSCGMFSGAGYGGVAGPVIGGAGSGYMNGGYMY